MLTEPFVSVDADGTIRQLSAVAELRAAIPRAKAGQVALPHRVLVAGEGRHVQLERLGREDGQLGQPGAEVGNRLAVEHQRAVCLALDAQGAIETAPQRLKRLGHVLRLSGERALC